MELCKLTKLSYSFSLFGNRLSGPLPDCLGTTLQNMGKAGPYTGYIQLQDNDFVGSIPPSWSQLQHVYELDLSSNPRLGGTVSKNWFLTNLTNLRTVDLHNCSFKGRLPGMERLTNLKSLDISHNNFVGRVPTKMGHYHPKLTKVNLAFNNFSGSLPSSFDECPDLEDIRLNDNSFQERIPFSWGESLSKVKVMRLHNNLLSGPIPSSFRGLTKLTKLWLFNNSLTGKISDELRELVNIQGKCKSVYNNTHHTLYRTSIIPTTRTQ